jgi:hypothetical protein
MRYRIGGVILLAAAVYLAQLEVRSQSRNAPVQANVPGSATFRLIFGGRDKAPTKWDGSLRSSGGRIGAIEGWRLAAGDTAKAPAVWAISTQQSPRGAETRLGEIAEKGVVVTVEGLLPDANVDVQTAGGNFTFTGRNVPLGAQLAVLDGRARVERLPETRALTTSLEDQDYPAIAASGDTIYLTYVEFTHSQRQLESFAQLKKSPDNFDWLSRPAGGDQVKLLRYSKSQRKWSEPENVSPPREDCMRTAVAVDGQGRLWIIWSANRGGNFDIYARSWNRGAWSREIRLTQDAGTDVNPVATTDSEGRVWVAWQGFRHNNLEVLAAAQEGNAFSSEQQVSISTASDWDPAIAAGPAGEVAVTWDTYDKGDYDVYARTMRYAKNIQMAKPMAVAASANFEARSSAAYDRAGRLWVAYEASGQKWGKDFGTYERDGISLYMGHTIRVKCFEKNGAFETSGPLDDALRTVAGLTGREGPPQMRQTNPGMAYTTVPGPRNSFPRIATDDSGRVYLTFRSGAGQRSAVGSIYDQYVTWYDGARWTRPVELPNTDNLVDGRAAVSGTGPNDAILIAVTDHRKSAQGGRQSEDASDTPARINMDLVVAEIHPGEAAKPMKISRVREEAAVAPLPAAIAERDAIRGVRGYRLNRGSDDLHLMRGEFHRHTEYSTDGGADGPLIDAYRYMIDAADMDWGGCCDHDNGNGRESAWWLHQKLTDAYLLGSRFVPMFSYERSVRYPEGHRNTIMVQRGVRPLPRLPKTADDSPADPAPDTQMLYRYLRQYKGIVASHTSATQMGTDWRDNDPILEPVVEIYQGERQNYEMPGAARAPEENFAVGGWRPLGFVSLALKKGYRLGFEASSDHISTHLSYCNLWVKNRTREGVMEAFRARRVYGATDNILADVRCGEHLMGEEFSLDTNPVLKVHLVGTADFAKVEIVRDGAVVHSTAPGARNVTFEWRDSQPQKGVSYYYVRGQQKDGELVWVSPMWIHLR